MNLFDTLILFDFLINEYEHEQEEKEANGKIVSSNLSPWREVEEELSPLGGDKELQLEQLGQNNNDRQVDDNEVIVLLVSHNIICEDIEDEGEG